MFIFVLSIGLWKSQGLSRGHILVSGETRGSQPQKGGAVSESAFASLARAMRGWSMRKPLRLRTSHTSLHSLSFSQYTLDSLPDSLPFGEPLYTLKLLFWSRHGNLV
jgi:hypothetical protein